MLKFGKNTLSYFLIVFIVISYFFGFYIREISNGAGHLDLELHIWKIVRVPFVKIQQKWGLGNSSISRSLHLAALMNI